MIISDLHYKFVKPSEIQSQVKIERRAYKSGLNDTKLTVNRVKELLSNSNYSNAVGKDERKYYLQLLIESGQIKTLAEASYVFNVTIDTIRKYLRELDMRDSLRK